MTKRSLSTPLCLLILCIVSWYVLFPLFHNGFFQSDDGEWMIIRLSAFVQSLREGQFPVRFLGRLNNSFGYPVSNFLYPGYLYAGSIIRYVGFSYVDTVKILLGCSVVISTFLVFYWLRSRFDRLASLIGAINFVLAPYVAFDLYTRGSVGEIFVLVPAALGFLSISKGWRIIFPFAISVLVVSHNSLALLFVGVFVSMLIVQKKWNFFLPLFIGLGLASFFWFPALYERRYIIFDSVAIANSHSYFLTGNRLLLIGIVPIVAWSTVIFQKKYDSSKFIQLYMVLFIMSVFMATQMSQFFWGETLTTLFQFPYRFLSLGLFAGSWVSSYFIQFTKSRVLVSCICVVILILQILPSIRSVRSVSRPEGYYTTNEGTTTVMDEYMPKWVSAKSQERANERVIFFKGLGSILPITISTQKIHVAVHSEAESVVQVNSIYYPGWGASVDGLPVKIHYQNPQGVMQVTIPGGKHTLLMEFRETVPRFISDMVSLFFLALYCGFIVLEIKKYQKNSPHSFIFKK